MIFTGVTGGEIVSLLYPLFILSPFCYIIISKESLDGTSSFFCRTWLLSFCAQNKWLVSGGRLGRDYISVNVYRDDRLYGIGSPGGNYVLYAGGS